MILKPGAPQTLALLPGHPFEGGYVEGTAILAAGSGVPEMYAVVYDQWGNRTAPCDATPFHLHASCKAVTMGEWLPTELLPCHKSSWIGSLCNSTHRQLNLGSGVAADLKR